MQAWKLLDKMTASTTLEFSLQVLLIEQMTNVHRGGSVANYTNDWKNVMLLLCFLNFFGTLLFFSLFNQWYQLLVLSEGLQ